jgi:hypothetical protein
MCSPVLAPSHRDASTLPPVRFELSLPQRAVLPLPRPRLATRVSRAWRTSTMVLQPPMRTLSPLQPAAPEAQMSSQAQDEAQPLVLLAYSQPRLAAAKSGQFAEPPTTAWHSVAASYPGCASPERAQRRRLAFSPWPSPSAEPSPKAASHATAVSYRGYVSLTRAQAHPLPRPSAAPSAQARRAPATWPRAASGRGCARFVNLPRT